MIPCNRVTEGCSKKHVRRKMSERGYARKADRGRESVRCPGDPAVVAIAGGYDRGDGKDTGGVTGRE